MDSRYGNEVSSLKIKKIIFQFLTNHTINFVKRIFYNYYLRDLSLASIELPLGIFLFSGGGVYGVYHWIDSMQKGLLTPAGTIMLSATSVLVGLQLLLAFFGYDIAYVPKYSRRELGFSLKKASWLMKGRAVL